MNRLVIATGNTHKTEEIRKLLGPYIKIIEDLKSYPEIDEIEETGRTFEENASLKASAVGEFLGENSLVLSDDSGLEVCALSGEPGVFSARYAGENASDDENRKKLLQKLNEIDSDMSDWSASFKCVMTLVKGSNKLATFEGSVQGTICDEERGENGFGYDSIFIPEGYENTFAELRSETKNSISHRYRALEAFKKWLSEV
ncbi:MAG: non-canonical purine NTP pyrophosphatase, RdgB/HAM1 family [Verrucomicrobiaceae bacterium TMED76]|nr:MAG: non-canonical purine NTP pyrophosphatase, RdgB/HAM1 family [Verrucomicrobiaceae bacterium TMED76]